MSKLFKSKFLIGVMVVTVMLVGFAFVNTQKAAAAECSITSTLRVGSVGAQVSCLQTAVGVSADGKFGSMTKAAVMAWQSAKGLVADGVFGAKSRAVWSGSTTTTPPTSSYPSGCTSASGYSSTTGMSCAGGSTYPAGCASGSGFSSTTGAPCSGGGSLPAGCATAAGFSSTTGLPCTVTTTNIGKNGYLADLSSDSTGRVSTVYEAEQDKVVAGFRATARLADQNIDRVRVTFLNVGTGSANLSRYISGASLWLGGTKLATMAIINADRATATDTYTFNFSGLAGKIPRDQIGRFYVSVNANGSLDTADTTGSSWTVKFVAAGVSSSSPDGTYDTYPAGDITQAGLLFGKFATSGVKAELNLSASNPVSVSVPVNATAVTNNVEVLKFKIKATNSSLTLRKVPVQISFTSPTTAANNIVNTINTVRLMQGTNVVDSVDPTASFLFTPGAVSTTATPCLAATAAHDFCTFYFSNLSSPYNTVASGTTSEYSIVIDFKAQTNYDTGSTVTTSIVNLDVLSATPNVNFSVLDMNGDQLPLNNSSIRIGSAVGNIMTLLVNGINVTQGAANITKISDNAGVITSVTYDIPLTVTAFGQTLYVGQAVELAAAASGATTTAKAFSFALQDSAAPAVNIVTAPAATAVTTTLSSSDALIETNGFRLDSGNAKHFIMQVILSCTAASCAGATTANYRVNTLTVRSATDGALTAPTNQTLLPAQSYQTLFQKIK